MEKSQIPLLVRYSVFGVWCLKIFLGTVNYELRTKKFYPSVLMLICCLVLGILISMFLIVTPVLAKEVVLLYTGGTHAMLYTCSCPKDPDGGVARRATLVKEIRTEHPEIMFLDSGSFFAGGFLDEHMQNTELDRQRTLVNLKAMELMKYDAVAVGDNELNFGKDFLLKQMNDTRLTFLSCNIETTGAALFKPYVVKEVSGTKIGIIGVTNPAANNKATGLRFNEPKPSVAQYVQELKNMGIPIIVLLSQLEEREDLDLINEIQGIDILIGNRHPAGDQPFVKLKSTLILKPFWQGRSLGKATLTVEDNRITKFKVERLPLSESVKDDPDVLSFLPRCFSDAHCKKEGLTGYCRNPGTQQAKCLFDKPNKVDLIVVTSKSCVTCKLDTVIDFLKKNFPGLKVQYLYYPEQKAIRLLESLDIQGLPVYLLGKEVNKEKNFDSLKDNLQPRGDFYVLKPQFSGISYFFNREKIKGKLDLFVSLYDKDTKQLLDRVEEFNPTVHFLAIEEKEGFDAAKGESETQEYLRAVCIQKYYPKEFWDYIRCRAQDISSSWWDDCAVSLDTNKIKSCAKGPEGRALLKENIRLNKELRILFGPAYLSGNQEIFASREIPSKEELKAIIKK